MFERNDRDSDRKTIVSGSAGHADDGRRDRRVGSWRGFVSRRFPTRAHPSRSAGNGGVGFEAVVEVVEYLGDEQLAHLRLGDRSLVAKLPVAERVEPGATTSFVVAREAVLFFAADSGARTDPPS